MIYLLMDDATFYFLIATGKIDSSAKQNNPNAL